MKHKNATNPYFAYASRYGDLIEPMRCQKWEDATPTGPLYVQPKFNGLRALALWGGGRWEFYSADGIFLSALLDYPYDLETDKTVILDGELFSPEKSLNEIQALVSRQAPIQNLPKDLSFYPFDCYVPNHPMLRQDRRLEIIAPYAPVIEIVSEQFYDMPFARHLHDKHEGAVYRSPRGIYEAGRRSWNLLKRKQLYDSEHLILAVNPGVGKFEDSFGSFTVATEKGSVNVGGGPGMTHEKRRELWENRDSLVGRYAQIQYPYTSSGGLPLQSQFVRLMPEDYKP